MMQKSIDKIMIVAMPRTGTTVIQKIISEELFSLPNFVEPFVGQNSQDPYDWISQMPKGVVKCLSTDLHKIDFSPFVDRDLLDHYVIISRDSLVDCCLSLYYAEMTKHYHYTRIQDKIKIEFECPFEYVDRWLITYEFYLSAIRKITTSGCSYDFINYDNFMADTVQYIAGVPIQWSKSYQALYPKPNDLISANFDYQKLCKNYQAVNDYIKEHIDQPVSLYL